MKKSFILYNDLIDVVDELDDNQSGLLFKAILKYQKGELLELPVSLRPVFSLIKSQFRRDTEKWEEIKLKRAEAGSRGGKQKVANASKSKQKVANASKSKQTLANLAVNVNDNVNVNVNENVNKIERTNKFVPPTLEDIKLEIQSKNYQIDAESFFAHYESNGWVQSSGVKIKNWKMTLVTWSKRQILHSKSNQFQKKEILEKTGAQKIWEKMQLQGMQNG